MGIAPATAVEQAQAILAGNYDNDEPMFDDRNARADLLRKAVHRVQVLKIAREAARQRVEQSRAVAGAALGKELAPVLSANAKRIRAAVAELHAASLASLKFQSDCEVAGYRVPAERFKPFTLWGHAAWPVCDLLGGWLDNNP